MHIVSVELENFRCFTDFAAKFSAHGVVLAGKNAVGKTALLEALTIGLRPIAGAFGAALSIELPLSVIRYQTARPGSSIVLEDVFPLKIALEVKHDDHGGRFEVGTADQTEAKRALALPLSQAQQAWKAPHQVLPLFMAYRADRGAPRSREGVQLNEALNTKVKRIDGYTASLRSRNAPTGADGLGLFVNAFAREELISLQENRDTDLKAALQSSLSSALEGNPVAKYVVRQSEVVLDFPDSGAVRLSELSAGQQSIAEIVTDLTVRAHALNPQFGSAAAERTPGIVLIDELELHLHPSWQRTIFTALRETFPLVQFIVTTHSPQVLGEVPSDLIHLLGPDGTDSVDQSSGMDSGWILRHLMSAESRSSAAAALITAAEQYMAAGQLTEARETLAKLRREFGNDPEIQRLSSRFDVMGKLLQ